MSRTIIFRAKSLSTGEMLQGYYFSRLATKEIHYLKCNFGEKEIDVEIDIKTLGQFTGLRDKNKKMIFEGDIILFKSFGCSIVNGVEIPAVSNVFFKNGCFYVKNNETSLSLAFLIVEINRFVKVIGNIHEDPEIYEIIN